MNELFTGFEEVMACIDDLLLITKETYEEHLEKLEKSGLKVNMNKSFFSQQELENLGYWITQLGIMPLAKKAAAIHEIHLPKNGKQLKGFIGIIKFIDTYRRAEQKD
eukprot:9050479-Ditylum_brightwellii.AAC.1